VLVVDSEGKPVLLHNESEPAGNWLSLDPKGRGKGNRGAAGAKIIVEAGGRKLLRRCGTDGSYLSASDRRVHVGLGDVMEADRITVRWPGGGTDVYAKVAANRVVILREGQGGGGSMAAAR
jgi:hypothetical protein